MKLEELCHRVPKIELHAHLHGSMRRSTLLELAQEKGLKCDALLTPVDQKVSRSMSECFQVFDLLHQTVTSNRIVKRLIHETIEDFAKDNTVYLELRTTPRALPDELESSALKYVELVHDTIEEIHASKKYVTQVRLILSINRNHSIQKAKETVDIAILFKQKSQLIVGIDFSGNPEQEGSDFKQFEPLLTMARHAGLKITVHFAEINDEIDSQQIMDFHPDRLGHAVCMSPEIYSRVLDSKVPIEICLTSNVFTRPELHVCKCCLSLSRKDDETPSCLSLACQMCKRNQHSEEVSSSVPSCCLCGYANHPLRDLVRSHPLHNVCLCTDDYGVFMTTLSTEYTRGAFALGLDAKDIMSLCKRGIPMIFDKSLIPDVEKAIVDFQLLLQDSM